MFNAYETVIDTLQTAKKQAVKSFVTHEAIASNLTKWIDAEAAIAKDAIRVGTETATAIGQELVKITQEAVQNDYAKKFQTWTQDLQKATKTK